MKGIDIQYSKIETNCFQISKLTKLVWVISLLSCLLLNSDINEYIRKKIDIFYISIISEYWEFKGKSMLTEEELDWKLVLWFQILSDIATYWKMIDKYHNYWEGEDKSREKQFNYIYRNIMDYFQIIDWKKKSLKSKI